MKTVNTMSFAQTLRSCLLPALLVALAAPSQAADDAVCARVKIEIRQELTMERQGFDAEMVITNGLTDESLTNVDIDVWVTDELGAPVLISSDPASTDAKFFVRVAGQQGVDDISGAGSVAASGTATINWLLIPAPGAAGTLPTGRKYLVGATLRYRMAGEDQVIDVSPDLITVRPMPLLTLDYFLMRDVLGDDPFTEVVEAPVPFTLGVRVRNTGLAPAQNLKIDSAQPKIIENEQGLLINFQLLDSSVDDLPAQNTLLANFGTINGGSAKMARWNMMASLSGQFTEFNVRFSHAAELGGQLTSLMQATNAHFLVRDVRVDLPGRDLVRDFLARDDDQLRVYESNGVDTDVVDVSAQATLTGTGLGAYRLTLPATTGFVYVKKPDPYNGQKVVGTVMRSDGKAMPVENVWLSRTQNPDTHQWSFWVNVFDVNTTGTYDASFTNPPPGVLPPVIAELIDRTVELGQQVSFLVEASSPSGVPVTLSSTSLPAGATLTPMAADPQAPELTRAIFDWTPTDNALLGSHAISITANDGYLVSTRAFALEVLPPTALAGPVTPTLLTPSEGEEVATQRPTFSVGTSDLPGDPATQVIFEVHRNEQYNSLLETSTVVRNAAGATTYVPGVNLAGNTNYWWRARTTDGTLYSPWAHGRLRVTLTNTSPGQFNLASPAAGNEVATLQPELAWTDAVDVQLDVLRYEVEVASDPAITALVAQGVVQPLAGGMQRWVVPVALSPDITYYWRVRACDVHGACSQTPARSFTVRTGIHAPSAPVLQAPLGSAASTAPTFVLGNSTDGDGDLLNYVIQYDSAATLDSALRVTSLPLLEGSGTTSWPVTGLVENRLYTWRAKAQDGRTESPWSVGQFRVNAANSAAAVPRLRNPGVGAWVGTRRPVLEVYPAVDPEGESVTYDYEVYADSAMAQRLTSGSGGLAWELPVFLDNLTTVYWRARSSDVHNRKSSWSALQDFRVNNQTTQPPDLRFAYPVTPVLPAVDGSLRTVPLRWMVESRDPSASVTLYYSTVPQDNGGMPIGSALPVTAGALAGSHLWDVSALVPGTYYVSAVISDSQGSRKVHAPGAVVVPVPAPAGTLVATVPAGLYTNESARSAVFQVRLSAAPASDVLIPLTSANTFEATVTPASLLFTPENWSVDQSVTVRGVADCKNDGTTQAITLLGSPVTRDGAYAGLPAVSVAVENRNVARVLTSIDRSDMYICNYSRTSILQVDETTWEFEYRPVVENLGQDARFIRATLASSLPAGWTLLAGTLEFRTVSQGEYLRASVGLKFRAPTSDATTILNVLNALSYTVAVEE